MFITIARTISKVMLETRQMQEDLSARMAALEPKPDSIPVSNLTTPLFFLPPHEQRHQFFHTPFKMEIPDFDGTEALVGSLRSTNFSISITPRRINDYQLFLFYMDGRCWGACSGCIIIIVCSQVVLRAFKHRFGPSHFEDPKANFLNCVVFNVTPIYFLPKACHQPLLQISKNYYLGISVKHVSSFLFKMTKITKPCCHKHPMISSRYFRFSFIRWGSSL